MPPRQLRLHTLRLSALPFFRSLLERLGPVPQNGTTTNKVPIAEVVEEAFNWVRRVRTEGQDWQLLPEPSVPELYPNMGGADDDMMLASSYDELEPGD